MKADFAQQKQQFENERVSFKRLNGYSNKTSTKSTQLTSKFKLIFKQITKSDKMHWTFEPGRQRLSKFRCTSKPVKLMRRLSSLGKD